LISSEYIFFFFVFSHFLCGNPKMGNNSFFDALIGSFVCQTKM
jgi:hypothetical protein